MTASDQPVKRKSGWGMLYWFCASLFVFLLIGLALPGHGPAKLGCQMRSAHQMGEIGMAAALYRKDHNGAYPERLSELLPDYIPTPDSFYLDCPSANAFVPPNAATEPKLIDAFSAYGFLALGGGRAIVFERLPMWSDHTIGFYLVPNDPQFTDKEFKFTNSFEQPRNRLSQEEFARQCLRSFNP